MENSLLKLSMTCGPYDRAQGLIDGSVKPHGIELDITVNDDDVDRQFKAARGDFDICEFFTGTYITDLPFKKLEFTAIPIFVKRMFRHSYIYINRKSGIRKPTDLNGRRVGIQVWTTTAALWAKGILEEEYGVDLKSITWVSWARVRVPDWKAPEWLKIEYAPEGIEQYDLLASGAIDAGMTTEIWAPGRHTDIDFLFPDYPEQERAYFRKTGCFPIMHILLVRDAVLQQHPWVARSLFDAWEASKQKLYARQEWERMHMTSLWYRGLWEEERAAAGNDIYPWGFRKSRKELDVMLRYAHNQALTPRKYEPEELFLPSMLDT